MMLSLQAAGCENINFVSAQPRGAADPGGRSLLAVDGGLRLPVCLQLRRLRRRAHVATARRRDRHLHARHEVRDDRWASAYPGWATTSPATARRCWRCTGRSAIWSWTSGEWPGAGCWCGTWCLPDGLAGTADVARFLADDVSRDTYINVMDQYRPAYNAALGAGAVQESTGGPAPNCAGILRLPTAAEYRAGVEEVLAAGLWRLEGGDLSGGANGGAPGQGRERGL